MTQIEAFTKELNDEAMATRKMLARIPTDKFNWQPHPKSMTIKRLATHIADIPNWVGMTFVTNELDFEQNPYDPKDLNTTEELLVFFEECQESAQQHLATASDECLGDTWILRSGETIFNTYTKYEVLRMSMSQIIHHRAQLGVCLRLLDIPIPGCYGPSADESF
jgi:uncharacterized damage-inducible protein DinB